MADFEAFSKDILREWPEGFDLDAADLQAMAIKHGLLTPVIGGFDPDKHECPHSCSERGDPWYFDVWSANDREAKDG